MDSEKVRIIRSIIIDDEAAARDVIKDYLKFDNSVKIVAECDNGQDAVNMILEKKPDLVFLDIQMPEMNGFEIIEAVGEKNLPFIIFITAYDKYAIKAFEINALDYLLKPFNNKRFQNSLDRAKKSILTKSGFKHQITELLDNMKREQKYSKRFLVKTGGRVVILNTSEINRFESVSDYIKIHTKNEEFLIRGTLSSTEKKLDPDNFIRIHKSCIVNINFIKEFQPWGKNSHIIILKDGISLKLSRSYRERFLNVFNTPED